MASKDFKFEAEALAEVALSNACQFYGEKTLEERLQFIGQVKEYYEAIGKFAFNEESKEKLYLKMKDCVDLF